MPDYCATTDLQKVFVDVGNYDRKLSFSRHDWTVFADNVDMQQDTGAVAKLYRNGVDLGAQQISAAACDADGKWFYKSGATDEILYCYNTNDADTYTWELAPLDWYTAQANAITNASEQLETLLDARLPRPIPQSNRTGGTYTYDYVIVKATALLACIMLVEASDPGASVLGDLRAQLYGDDGIITRINSGDARLSFEWTRSDGGQLEEGSIDATTTGRPIDAVGSPTVAYNKYKILIVTGDDVDAAVDNTIASFSVTDIEGNAVLGETIIDQAGYHGIGGGYSVRFIPGKYVADDYWWLTVVGVAPSTSVIQEIRMVR
jgi:hypothetical protein